MKPSSFILILLITVLGCSDGPGPSVHFVIPDGFKGKIDIVQDSKNGVTLANHEGTLVCIVPTNGQFGVKSLRPFQSWHSETASFANGMRLLPVGTSDISLFALGSYASGSTQGVTYFIGMREEADKLKY